MSQYSILPHKIAVQYIRSSMNLQFQLRCMHAAFSRVPCAATAFRNLLSSACPCCCWLTPDYAFATLTSPSRERFQGRFAQSPVNDCHLTVRWLNAGSYLMQIHEGVDNRNYIYFAKKVIVAAFFVDACDLVFVDQTQRSTHTCGRVDYKCRLNSTIIGAWG